MLPTQVISDWASLSTCLSRKGPVRRCELPASFPDPATSCRCRQGRMLDGESMRETAKGHLQKTFDLCERHIIRRSTEHHCIEISLFCLNRGRAYLDHPWAWPWWYPDLSDTIRLKRHLFPYLRVFHPNFFFFSVLPHFQIRVCHCVCYEIGTTATQKRIT